MKIKADGLILFFGFIGTGAAFIALPSVFGPIICVALIFFVCVS